MYQSQERILAYLDRLEDDIDTYQERLNYLSAKRDKVEEDVERLMDNLQDVLKRKKGNVLAKLDELYFYERQKLLTDKGPQKTGNLENRKTKPENKDKPVISAGSEEESAESHLPFEDMNIQDNNDDKPTLVDLNLNVNFGELMNTFSNLHFGDINAIYSDKGMAVMKKISPPLQPASPNSESSEENIANSVPQSSVISTAVEEDKCRPRLNDIAVVELEDVIVVSVTDRSNMCIKSFYKRGGTSFYSTYSTPSPPRGIAKLGGETVGVTLPDCSSISVLKVTPALVQDQTIQTAKRYRGIAMLDSNRLVVGSYAVVPGAVDIIDYTGVIHRTITTGRNGVFLFDSPSYLCTTGERNIIVSDCEKRTVTCMSVTGRVIFQYQTGAEVAVTYPLGVVADRFGDILVADCDNNKVVKILNDGQGAKDFLSKKHGISGPYSIDMDKSGFIYVAGWKGNIKIFDKS